MLSLGQSLNSSKKCGSPGRPGPVCYWEKCPRGWGGGRVRNRKVILWVRQGRPRKDHSLPILTEAHAHDVTGFNTRHRVAFLSQAAPSTHIARKAEFKNEGCRVHPRKAPQMREHWFWGRCHGETLQNRSFIQTWGGAVHCSLKHSGC